MNTTIPFEIDGHIQDLHRAFHPDKFEYDEIIDENDNRKLIKRKVEFVVVKLEDGRIVHKQNDPIEDEIIEFEDTNVDKKTLKRKAQYRQYIDDENRIIRQKLQPQAFEFVEMIDEKKR